MALFMTAFQVTADKLAEARGKDTSVDHRIFKALQTISRTGKGADGALLAALVEDGWPLHKAAPGQPQQGVSDETLKALDNNFAIFSSLHEAGQKMLPELSLRDHLNTLARRDNFTKPVAYMREHVGSLETAAKKISTAPKS